MNVSFDSILDIYRKFKPHIINYSIPSDSKTFTILSALNILVKDYVTFNTKVTSENRLLHIEAEESTSRLHYNHLTGRPVDVSTLDYLTASATTATTTTNASTNTQACNREYRNHVEARAASSNLHNDNAYIIEREWSALQQ